MNPQPQRSLRPLALTLTLLMATAALPIPESLESLGDGTPANEFSSKSASNPDLEFAKYLHKLAYALKKQMCENQNMCDDSNEVLAKNNLKLPNITEKNGCLPTGFNEETCLLRIISGLQEFDTYLQFLGKEMKDNKIRSLKLGTIHLAQSLKLLIKKTDAVPTPNPTASSNLLLELEALTGWAKNVSLRLILWHYTRFLEGTIRAVRYLHTRSLIA